jgi:hypothetical protein
MSVRQRMFRAESNSTIPLLASRVEAAWTSDVNLHPTLRSGARFVLAGFLRATAGCEGISPTWYHFGANMTHTPRSETEVRSSLITATGLALGKSNPLGGPDAVRLRPQQMEKLLRDLRNGVRLLDQSIDAEMRSVSICDPSHFAFPMIARSMLTRRDNLRATIASLSALNCGRLETAAA